MKKDTKKEIEKFLDLNLDNFIANHIFKEEKNIDDLLKWIQQKLSLKNFPYKIVCLDISHSSWKNPVWWLSALLWWISSKKNFRKFKIPKELWWNDYESLKYCILKYSKNNETDLFVLDWWKWQLNIINDLPSDIVLKTDFISIWKWKARERKWKNEWLKEKIFTYDKTLNINYWNFEDRILLKLRDEAHNFANKYRKKLEKLR